MLTVDPCSKLIRVKGRLDPIFQGRLDPIFLIFIKVSEYVGGSINLIISGRMVETKSGKLISTFERSQVGSQITISNSKILNKLAYELGNMIVEKSHDCKNK